MVLCSVCDNFLQSTISYSIVFFIDKCAVKHSCECKKVLHIISRGLLLEIYAKRLITCWK